MWQRASLGDSVPRPLLSLRAPHAVSNLGLDGEWHAFRDEARRELARNFLEDNGLRWK